MVCDRKLGVGCCAVRFRVSRAPTRTGAKKEKRLVIWDRNLPSRKHNAELLVLQRQGGSEPIFNQLGLGRYVYGWDGLGGGIGGEERLSREAEGACDQPVREYLDTGVEETHGRVIELAPVGDLLLDGG